VPEAGHGDAVEIAEGARRSFVEQRDGVLGEELAVAGVKTGGEERVQAPEELLEILRWHVETQLRTPAQQASDLLFPALHGGFRTRNVLDKPFRAAARTVGLEKRVTPRGMRRTFQDLCRATQVGDLVTRSISGHATEAMQRHYSTVVFDEQRRGIASVIQLLEPHTLLPGRPNSPPLVGREVGRRLPEVGRIEGEAGIAS
jgi:integrase